MFIPFCHFVVCPSSLYVLWLPLWYFQTLLNNINLELYVSTIDNFAEIGNDSGHVLELDKTTLKYWLIH